jgi:hypothetical protein
MKERAKRFYNNINTKTLKSLEELITALWPNTTSLFSSFVCQILSRMHVY